MGPRVTLSSVLIAGAIVLLIGIVVGNGMGNRVLSAVADRSPALSTTPLPIATPSPGASDNPKSFSWKRRQVISVATDPAFPDPRITPEPTPVPTARPTPKPTPRPTRRPVRATPRPKPTVTATSTYTSPPLLYPMGSNAPVPGASSSASEPASPNPQVTRSLSPHP